MPLKIIHPDHLEIVGRGPLLLSSPLRSQFPDESYGKIVEEIALLSKAHAIIKKEPKRSHSATVQFDESEFETALKRLCLDNQIKCIIEIDGKKEPGIQIHAAKTDERTKEMINLLRAGFPVDFDLQVFEGSKSDLSSSVPDDAEVILLSLGLSEIGYRREAIITALADTVGLINARLGYSESPGNTLD